MALLLPPVALAIGGGTSYIIYSKTFAATRRLGFRLRFRDDREPDFAQDMGGWALPVAAGAASSIALKMVALDSIVPPKAGPQAIREFRQFIAIVGPRALGYFGVGWVAVGIAGIAKGATFST